MSSLILFKYISVASFDYEHLKIPRKPYWNRDMTPEDVDRNEKDAFLDWRRNIAVRK